MLCPSSALRTHPDRALPERKAEAETNFKRVAEWVQLRKQDTLCQSLTAPVPPLQSV